MGEEGEMDKVTEEEEEELVGKKEEEVEVSS